LTFIEPFPEPVVDGIRIRDAIAAMPATSLSGEKWCMREVAFPCN
jgi:hypothetical protein